MNQQPHAPAQPVTVASAPEGGAGAMDPETLKKLAPQIAKVRAQVRENFGKVVMALMQLPRYRHETLADLQRLVLEPMLRDRVAMAYPNVTEDNALADLTGLAIWASVSDEVDGKIREQIRAGVFPIRLKADDWTSGEIPWLLDVVAPDAKTATLVLSNFRQVVKTGNLRLHPLITRLVDEDALKKMGVERMEGASEQGTGTAHG